MADDILLFGADGQVGWELRRSLATLGRVRPLVRRDVDLADADAIRQAIRAVRPSVVVNAAAYTAVDRAEQEPELARRLNATAPAVVAEEANACEALLVHYSTDYVFDGTKSAPYVEDDATNPLSVYGRTKLEGEVALQAARGRHLVFRTSWVFSARGGNFLRTILHLARERLELSVVADQIGAPTSAEMIADVSARAIVAAHREAIEPGIYHLTARGETSWHGYATHVVRRAAGLGASLALTEGAIRAIPTTAYPLPATRPANSRLATDRIERSLGVYLPEWEEFVDRALREILQP